MLLLSACNRALPEREAELAALRRDEAHLAAQLNLLTRNVTSLRASTQGEENRSRTNAAALRELQVEQVETWKGEADALAAKKAAVKLPPNLAAALDLAQSIAGGETLEKRFARGLTAKDPASLAKVLEYWETNWLALNHPEEEEPEPKVCPTTRSLSCTPIDDDSLWCPDPEQSAAWALLLDNGSLTVGRLGAGQGHVVDARLAPRVWLTRLGDAEGGTGALFLHTLRGGSFQTQWQARLTRDGVHLESLKANFDEDPFTEGLFWTKEDLLFADPTSRDDVTLLRDLQACDALALLEGVPAPVRERCRALKAPPVAVDAGVP
ncbi:MAG: hypothetical protein Q8L48_36530 [Archangium sp.]|nr:hypothetical protein [Archangium sp.]